MRRGGTHGVQEVDDVLGLVMLQSKSMLQILVLH
jgi:hypothetical protein